MTDNLNEFETKMNSTLSMLNDDFSKLRVGRANARLLDDITVEYYGTPTPLNQVSGISVPEARTLMISPFDSTILGDIEKAIYASDLGLTPNNDGSTIRLTIPPLTEETRKDIVKEVKAASEKSKISIRNIRREILNKISNESNTPEDLKKKQEKDAQKLTDKYVEKINVLEKSKEKEILEK